MSATSRASDTSVALRRLHGCRVVIDEVSVAGPRKSDGRGVLAYGSGEAAEGPAAAGGVGLAFQPGDGGEADPGLISQFLLGQAALAT
jgi:hypothetical protein